MRSASRTIGSVVAGLVLGLATNFAVAQPVPGGGYGMGPGMMGGGYGTGTMGGYGMGPGTMGGYGMGPGMMGGYGVGPGVMGGYGRWSGYAELGLTADQRTKVEQIHRDLRTKNWALMGKMMDARYKLADLYDADKVDAAAIKAQYKEIEDLRLQMVDAALDAHTQIDALLTKEQKEKARQWHHGPGRMMGAY